MKLLICKCEQCKHGRQRGPHDVSVRQKTKCARMMVRQLLARGEYDNLPVVVEIGYTD